VLHSFQFRGKTHQESIIDTLLLSGRPTSPLSHLDVEGVEAHLPEMVTDSFLAAAEEEVEEQALASVSANSSSAAHPATYHPPAP